MSFHRVENGLAFGNLAYRVANALAFGNYCIEINLNAINTFVLSIFDMINYS